MMHQCFVQKLNLPLSFKRDWPHHNSDPIFPGFSMLLVTDCWPQVSFVSQFDNGLLMTQWEVFNETVS